MQIIIEVDDYTNDLLTAIGAVKGMSKAEIVESLLKTTIEKCKGEIKVSEG